MDMSRRLDPLGQWKTMHAEGNSDYLAVQSEDSPER